MHEPDPQTGHCVKCGMVLGAGRDGLPCLAELRMRLAEVEIAKRTPPPQSPPVPPTP